MKIQVLGTGCAKCKQLTANAEKAVAELGVQATVEKVEDLREIMKFGVMTTPALVVDGKVRSAGKVLSPQDVKLLRPLERAAGVVPVGHGEDAVGGGEPPSQPGCPSSPVRYRNPTALRRSPRRFQGRRCRPQIGRAPRGLARGRDGARFRPRR